MDGKYYLGWKTVVTDTGTYDGPHPPIDSQSTSGSWSELSTTTRTATCSSIMTTCSFVASASSSYTSGVAGGHFDVNFSASADQTGTSASASCSPSGPSDSGLVYPNTGQTNDLGGYMRAYDASGYALQFYGAGPVTVDTFTAEYTTSQLQSDTLAALPAWGALSAFGGGYPGELASAELSSTEATYSVLESKYQMAHPVPPGGTYELTWLERFTPDGGSPMDTEKSYSWDGTIPTGYNATDSSTWPKTATFEVDHPSTNGVVTFHSLAVDCGAGPTTLFS